MLGEWETVTRAQLNASMCRSIAISLNASECTPTIFLHHTPLRNPTFGVISTLDLKIVRRYRCLQPRIRNKFGPVDAQPTLHDALVCRRDCEPIRLLVQQKHVVVRVLGGLGRRRGAKVGRRAGGLGGEDRRAVLFLARGRKVLEQRVEDGAAGGAVGAVNVYAGQAGGHWQN